MAILFGEKCVSGIVSGGGQNDYTINAIARCTGGETSLDVFVAACADSTNFPFTMNVTLPGGYPTTFIRETIRVSPKDDEGQAPTWFEVNIPYVVLGMSREPYVTGDQTKQFTIGYQSVTRMISLNTTGYPTGSAPDHQNTIGVTDTEVQGVAVDDPTFIWSETHIISNSAMTDAYAAALYGVSSNPVNDAPFKGFAAGEVKFMGVEGAQRHKGGDWELNFKFAASPNLSSYNIGSITGIAKKGWEYVWVKWVETSVSSQRVVRAKFAYVETVYRTSNFATLGIGT